MHAKSRPVLDLSITAAVALPFREDGEIDWAGFRHLMEFCMQPGGDAFRERLWLLVQAIYAPPRVEIHARIKTALMLLGVIERDLSRAPVLPVSAESRERLTDAPVATGLLPEAE